MFLYSMITSNGSGPFGGNSMMKYVHVCPYKYNVIIIYIYIWWVSASKYQASPHQTKNTEHRWILLTLLHLDGTCPFHIYPYLSYYSIGTHRITPRLPFIPPNKKISRNSWGTSPIFVSVYSSCLCPWWGDPGSANEVGELSGKPRQPKQLIHTNPVI